MRVKIEVSARHVHLRAGTYLALFGKEKPEKTKKLTVGNEYALGQVVNLKTNKGEIKNVRVLYPFRDYDQVEISKTDAYKLGINPPVRDSDELDLAGTCGITLVGPKGKVELEKGVILAWRHIHMDPVDALELGIEDGAIVKVDMDDNPRSYIFENVLVRVKAGDKTVMHIDTDEGNAAGLEKKGKGRIIV